MAMVHYHSPGGLVCLAGFGCKFILLLVSFLLSVSWVIFRATYEILGIFGWLLDGQIPKCNSQATQLLVQLPRTGTSFAYFCWLCLLGNNSGCKRTTVVLCWAFGIPLKSLRLIGW